MRHDQSDEPDQPGNGDSRRRGQGCRSDEQQLPSLDRDAERGGLLLAKLQRVHDAAAQHHDTATEQHHRRDETHLLPACRVETAEKPGVDDEQLVTSDVHQIRGGGARCRAHGNAGQQQRGGRHTATNASQEIDRHDRGSGAHKSEHLHGAAAREIAWYGQNERGNGAKARSGGDTQKVGIRQWVAKDALIGGAGDSQRRADEASQGDARQANLEQDGLGSR